MAEPQTGAADVLSKRYIAPASPPRPISLACSCIRVARTAWTLKEWRMTRAGMCVSRSGMWALICALGAAAGCADLFGPDEPDVTVTLEAVPPSAAARALRVVVGDRAMEVPAPPSGRAREERTLRAPGFG